jgi:hypothetical protein
MNTKWKKGLAGLLAGGGAVCAAVVRRGRGRQQGHEAAVTEPAAQTTAASTPDLQEGDGSLKEVHGDVDAV